MVCKILIVEDHEDTALVTALLLRKAGHLVTVASTYQHAMELAAEQQPNVLVCDIGLPDGDGCDLVRELLKDKHKFTAIAVTAHGMPADKERYIEAGFSEFVIKPCNIDQITTAIARAKLFSKRPSASSSS